MLDLKKAVCLVVGDVDGGIPDVFGVLDQSGAIVQVTCGVQVEVCDMIPKGRK